MQGVYLAGYKRPKTKAEFKRAVVENAALVRLQATSPFGNEYDGALSEAPEKTYYVVGPDPYKSRKWYAQVHVGPNGIRIA